MPSDPPPLIAVLRPHLVGDHQKLEVDLGQVAAELEIEDHAKVRALWAPFEARTRVHLDAEDHHLLPSLLRWRKRDAQAIVEEHKLIRGRLSELAQEIAAGKAKVSELRRFCDELRAHARTEELRVYQWADEHLHASAKEALLAASQNA